MTSLDPDIAARLKRDADGLVPAVVQQHDTGEVLMVGWMDDEALHRTLTHRADDVLEPVAPGVLGQGRDLRPPAVGQGGAARLRRRHPAGQGRPGGPGLPHRRPHLLRRHRRCRSPMAERTRSRSFGPTVLVGLAAAALTAVAASRTWAHASGRSAGIDVAASSTGSSSAPLVGRPRAGLARRLGRGAGAAWPRPAGGRRGRRARRRRGGRRDRGVRRPSPGRRGAARCSPRAAPGTRSAPR